MKADSLFFLITAYEELLDHIGTYGLREVFKQRPWI